MHSTSRSNARLEGLHNKIRLLSHRSYGLHSPQALIALFYLCCAGITITPPLKRATQTREAPHFGCALPTAADRDQTASTGRRGPWLARKKAYRRAQPAPP